MMRAIPARAASLLPALLALESLAALALGWAAYRRLSPVQIGPPLSPLIDFTFNDQLVWGLAVGATLCLCRRSRREEMPATICCSFSALCI